MKYALINAMLLDGSENMKAHRAAVLVENGRIAAIADDESGFGEVSAKTLAKEIGIKLECRRQTSENGFYYVICGDTHRLFLMTDKAGIVKDVILSSGLPSKEAIEQQIETGKRIGWSLSRMGIPGMETFSSVHVLFPPDYVSRSTPPRVPWPVPS